MTDEGTGSQTTGKLEDDVDALFKLPVAEFIGARNDLVARLKRAGSVDDANRVKALAKPSISAWAVNQLHWKRRDALDRLLATSQLLRQAQASPASGSADLRGSLEARRQALSRLSDLAAELMRDAGYNPTLDTLHRITTTLEAISANATPSDGPTPGRLTQDVDPPGFGSLSSLIPTANTTARNVELSRIPPPHEPASPAPKTAKEASPEVDLQKIRQAEETRRAKIAAAKVSLQEAKRSLTEAQSNARRLEAAQKKADAEAKEADAQARHAEKQLREAEERFKRAGAALQEAADRAKRRAAEAEEGGRAVEEGRRAIEKISKQIESLLQESTAEAQR